jgi:hypothetical protein
MLHATAARSGFRDLSVGLPGSVPKVSRAHSRDGKAGVNRLLITKCWATETKRLNLD